MYKITLRGTPAEMGRTHGEQLRGLPLPPWDDRMTELALGCEAVVRQHTPAYLEEMEAFAAAAEMDPALLKAFTICAPFQQTIPSCSIVAVLPERSANGKLLVGRNYDFDYAIARKAAATYHTFPQRGLAHVGNCDIWIGREDGMNEAGLFVGMSATFLPGVQPGLTFWFVVRHILENCATVEEAKRWIASVPHAQSRNFMLADAQTAVVVEATIEGVRVREASDGILVMTNHPLHPDWTARDSYASEDSCTRFARLSHLADGAISRADLERALNDRPSGVCAHARWETGAYGTIWSIIACPEERTFAFAEGVGESGTMQYHDIATELHDTELRHIALRGNLVRESA